MTITERIEAIEKLIPGLPGTQISRVMHEESGKGVCWSLGLGGLGQPKRFFGGPTIEDCLDQAEIVIQDTISEMTVADGSQNSTLNQGTP